MDSKRIRGLGYLRSFQLENGELSWNQECAWKFIVVDNYFIIAPMFDHISLYSVFMTRELLIEEAKEKANAIATAIMRNPWPNQIIAAGMVNAQGVVTEWKSSGFRVQTPLDRQPELQAIITDLFQTGRLNPVI